MPIDYASVGVAQIGCGPHQVPAGRRLARSSRNNFAMPFAGAPYAAGINADWQRVRFDDYPGYNVTPNKLDPGPEIAAAPEFRECGCQSCGMNPDALTSFEPTPIHPVFLEIPIPVSPQQPATSPTAPATGTPADKGLISHTTMWEFQKTSQTRICRCRGNSIQTVQNLSIMDWQALLQRVIRPEPKNRTENSRCHLFETSDACRLTDTMDILRR